MDASNQRQRARQVALENYRKTLAVRQAKLDDDSRCDERFKNLVKHKPVREKPE